MEEKIFEKMKDEINTLIIEDIGTDNFDDNTSLHGDLCADSMDMVEFIMDIEAKFDIAINSEDEERMNSDNFKLKDLYALVEKKVVDSINMDAAL